MRVAFSVDESAATHEFADVVIRVEGTATSKLDVEYDTILDRCGTVDPVATDLLMVASAVYATDKLVSRAAARDRWTRDLSVTIPVSAPRRWARVREPLTLCLRFLTGDRWDVTFTALPAPLVRPSSQRTGRVGSVAGHSAVCLYSGGLDSLIGAIDWLSRESGRLLLVGHHDRHAPGPKKDQLALIDPLEAEYPDRITTLLTRIGIQNRGAEITYRSRSLLFLALGVQAAAAVGAGTPVLIPENGTIALNLPLTPARRGTCSTRTAHPHYLDLFQAVVDGVGLSHRVSNPLFAKTKGECVRDCENSDLLERLYGHTGSCAKRGHRSSWIRMGATQCGRCMPCLYRRAALHSMGWDTEKYGSDVCTGEVPLDSQAGRSTTASSDLRAMLSCLRANPSEPEIAARLLANGPLSPAALSAAAATVARTLDEVRDLFREKGTAAIRHRGGLDARRVGRGKRRK